MIGWMEWWEGWRVNRIRGNMIGQVLYEEVKIYHDFKELIKVEIWCKIIHIQIIYIDELGILNILEMKQ